METNNRFDLMIDQLTNIVGDQNPHQTRPSTGLPSLKSLLAESNALPQEALYLGLAEDGLPVLLNLYDPTPGPILIAGDQESGKTTLLKMIARAVDLIHSPAEVQYCIISNRSDEWNRYEQSENSVGLYPIQHEATANILESLVDWAHTNKGKDHAVILLIDDLYEISKLGGLTEQHLRWLLLRGPSRNVWPIVTLNSAKANDLQDWLTFFRTRFFGQIMDAEIARTVSGMSLYKLNDLIPGSQFAMRESNKLLKFWVPLID
ncbi:MAG: hypothetical protein JNM55_00215 [Anaerolineales bacterium]|nr:hypothetical protein [Anaerolineales bacterium]